MTNHVPRSPEPPAAHNAVERLHEIQMHNASLVRELVHNWRGWTGSFFVDATIVLLLILLAQGVVKPLEKEYFITQESMETSQEIERDKLPDFDTSPVQTDIDKVANVDADVMRENVGFNELDPGAPDWITSGGHLVGRIGNAGGGGDDWGGKGWDGYRTTIQRSGLEVMFVFDSTGSMGGPITEVRNRIRQLMKVVNYIVPNARIGMVTYRDKKQYDLDDYEYTVKYLGLQKGNKDGLDKLQRFLRETEAYGGGDIPEAVLDGVQTAVQKAGWTPSTKKVIIVFGDAPPRPEDNGLSKMYDLCRKWQESGGVLSAIDTRGGSKLMDEFKQMASDGGGEALFLNDERAIVKQLVMLIFGTKWEKEIDKIYKEVLPSTTDTVIGE